MYPSHDRLIVFDADGTLIDAFAAIERTFARHGMSIGDLARFQKRHKLFKYLGGLREFPGNLTRHLGNANRAALLDTLTSVYRSEATLFPGLGPLILALQTTPGIRLAMISRNVTHNPRETLTAVFERHGIDLGRFDYLAFIAPGMEKTAHMREARDRLGINPARCIALGDEHHDYNAIIAAGMTPLMVSYGFDNHERLTRKFGVPDDVVSKTPEELVSRLCHTIDLPEPVGLEADADVG
ncbi:HAD family hydrolase [Chitinibacteraceae bacterium HSL-7]